MRCANTARRWGNKHHIMIDVGKIKPEAVGKQTKLFHPAHLFHSRKFFTISTPFPFTQFSRKPLCGSFLYRQIKSFSSQINDEEMTQSKFEERLLNLFYQFLNKIHKDLYLRYYYYDKLNEIDEKTPLNKGNISGNMKISNEIKINAHFSHSLYSFLQVQKNIKFDEKIIQLIKIEKENSPITKVKLKLAINMERSSYKQSSLLANQLIQFIDSHDTQLSFYFDALSIHILFHYNKEVEFIDHRDQAIIRKSFRHPRNFFFQIN